MALAKYRKDAIIARLRERLRAAQAREVEDQATYVAAFQGWLANLLGVCNDRRSVAGQAPTTYEQHEALVRRTTSPCYPRPRYQTGDIQRTIERIEMIDGDTISLPVGDGIWNLL